MFATVATDLVETYELGLLRFTPGERVRVVARAICGPEARTLIRTEEGLALHLEQGEDMWFDFDEDEEREEVTQHA